MDKYESKDLPDLTAEQTKYYDRKMALDEDPEDFILEMEIKREKLLLLKDTSMADDTKFKRDILSKLPNSPEAPWEQLFDTAELPNEPVQTFQDRLKSMVGQQKG